MLVKNFLAILLFLFLNIHESQADRPYKVNVKKAGTTASVVMDPSLKIVEQNGFADIFCDLLKIVRSDLFQVFIFFAVFTMGLAALKGQKIELEKLIKVYFAISMFYGSYSFYNFLFPYSNVSAGCDCKTEMFIGRDNYGNPIFAQTGLDKDCNNIKV